MRVEISIKIFPKGRDKTHNHKMTEVAIPQGEHKDPKQLIQGGVKGGENTPLGDQNKIYIPTYTRKRIMYPILERTKKEYAT